MSNGEGHWAAIAELRAGYTAHEREFGLVNGRLEAALGEIAEVKTDVNNLGEDIRKTRHDLRDQITAVEGRLVMEIAKVRATQDARVRSAYVFAVSCFTLALVIAGTVVALTT